MPPAETVPPIEPPLAPPVDAVCAPPLALPPAPAPPFPESRPPPESLQAASERLMQRLPNANRTTIMLAILAAASTRATRIRRLFAENQCSEKSHFFAKSSTDWKVFGHTQSESSIECVGSDGLGSSGLRVLALHFTSSLSRERDRRRTPNRTPCIARCVSTLAEADGTRRCRTSRSDKRRRARYRRPESCGCAHIVRRGSCR